MRVPYAAVVKGMNAAGSHWERFQLESVIALDGDDHKRIRDVVAPASLLILLFVAGYDTSKNLGQHIARSNRPAAD